MPSVKKLQDAPAWGAGKRYRKYNFRAMAIGELMTVPVDEQGCKDIKSFRALVWNRARQLGFTLSCRELEDGTFEVYRSA